MNKKSNDFNMEEISENFYKSLTEGHTENYFDYMKFLSNFHTYSMNNTMLIWLQNKNATKVAGFKTWSNLGYKIKKGSKSIKILAPRTCKYIEDKNGEKIFWSKMTKEQKADKINHKTFTFFDYVSVFDKSQVEKIDGTEDTLFYPLGNSHKEQYLTFKSIIEKKGIMIEEGCVMAAEGVSCGGIIKLKEGLDYNNKLLTLIHEFTHEILDQDVYNKFQESDRNETTRNIRELRAESVSYIVSNYLQLDNPFSKDYVLNWSDKESFITHLTTIKETSDFIIQLIDKSFVDKKEIA